MWQCPYTSTITKIILLILVLYRNTVIMQSALIVYCFVSNPLQACAAGGSSTSTMPSQCIQSQWHYYTKPWQCRDLVCWRGHGRSRFTGEACSWTRFSLANKDHSTGCHRRRRWKFTVEWHRQSLLGYLLDWNVLGPHFIREDVSTAKLADSIR